MKGPAVADRYAMPGLRTYEDIDLLVPSGQFPRWEAFLASLGYTPPDEAYAVTQRGYGHHVALTRAWGDTNFDCELHRFVSFERRVRGLDYEALAAFTEPSHFPGLLQLHVDAQIVLLAVHWAKHASAGRRLIWLRDFIELATPDAVASARVIARDHDLSWALERALYDTEQLLGSPVWNASPPDAPESFGLAAMHDVEEPGHLFPLALMRELGPVGSVKYVVTRFDPRRFIVPGKGFDWKAFRGWVAKQIRLAGSTPWSRLFRRARRT
jgi:hypothetical protein